MTAAQSKSVAGKVTGVVRDASGTPQLGASVELVPEVAGAVSSQSFLTNTQGIFRGDRLTPGLYSIRVTLAGFLPTLQQHVRINPNLTTMVRIEMESMFAALEQLRRQPNSSHVEADDWKWVLRTSNATRPVLRLLPGWQIDDHAAERRASSGIFSDTRALVQVSAGDGGRVWGMGTIFTAGSCPTYSFQFSFDGLPIEALTIR